MSPRPHYDETLRRLVWGRLIEPPRIDGEACTGCGQCVAVCSGRVIEVHDKMCRVVASDSCFACGHCWAVCPERAVAQPDSAAPEASDFAREPPVAAAELEAFLGQRRSVRVFNKDVVEREVLSRVASAARHAPTGANKQNVELVVVATPERVDELRGMLDGVLAKLFAKLDNPLFAKLFEWKTSEETLAQMRLYSLRIRWLQELDRPSPYFPLPDGPAVMLAHANAADSSADFSCIAALHTCALAAQAEGLGSCYLGFLMAAVNLDAELRSWLGIPRGNKCFSAMVLGYPKTKFLRPVKRPGLTVTWR